MGGVSRTPRRAWIWPGSAGQAFSVGWGTGSNTTWNVPPVLAAGVRARPLALAEPERTIVSCFGTSEPKSELNVVVSVEKSGELALESVDELSLLLVEVASSSKLDESLPNVAPVTVSNVGAAMASAPRSATAEGAAAEAEAVATGTDWPARGVALAKSSPPLPSGWI